MKKEILLFSLIIITGLVILFPQKIKDLKSTCLNYFQDAPSIDTSNNDIISPNAQEKVDTSPEAVPEVQTQSAQDNLFTPLFWYNATAQDIETSLTPQDIKKRNAKGVSLLMYASSISNNIHTIDTLLNRGASVHTRDEQGRDALMYAASFNQNPRIISFLLYHKAKIDAQDKNGHTALMLADMYNSNPEIIQTLINKGADINKRVPHVQTQMTRASFSNKIVMAVKLGLTEAKDLIVNLVSAPFAEKSENSTDLFDTLSNSIDSLSDKLINKEEGMTALMFAAKYSKSPLVLETLIDNGADVKLYDNTGQTALDYAKNNKALFNTDIYWKINDMLYDNPPN